MKFAPTWNLFQPLLWIVFNNQFLFLGEASHSRQKRTLGLIADILSNTLGGSSSVAVSESHAQDGKTFTNTNTQTTGGGQADADAGAYTDVNSGWNGIESGWTGGFSEQGSGQQGWTNDNRWKGGHYGSSGGYNKRYQNQWNNGWHEKQNEWQYEHGGQGTWGYENADKDGWVHQTNGWAYGPTGWVYGQQGGSSKGTTAEKVSTGKLILDKLCDL